MTNTGYKTRYGGHEVDDGAAEGQGHAGSLRFCIISAETNLKRFELAASLRRLYFLKAELLVELIVRLTVDLDIRVDKVIESGAILLGR